MWISCILLILGAAQIVIAAPAPESARALALVSEATIAPGTLTVSAPSIIPALLIDKSPVSIGVSLRQ